MARSIDPARVVRRCAAQLAGLMCLVGLQATAGAAMAPLAKDGEAHAKIYVAPPAADASEQEAKSQTLAIEDLQHHLKQMTGADFEVVTTDDPSQVTPPAIVFGDLAVQMGATPQQDTVTDDAFRLIVREPGVVLFGGEGAVASSHAMYRWLQSLGVQWIMPGPNGELIPQRPTLVVDEVDLAEAPDFLVRAPWYSGGPNIVTAEERAQLEQWKRRMGQTHGSSPHPDFMQGGHAWAYMISRYKDQLAEDPSMFAQVRQPDGSFGPSRFQLDPAHPGVVDLTVQYIRDEFERNNWPQDKAVALSIGPNDGAGYSESPATQAISAGRVDPVTGGTDETDALIYYANQVIERVQDEFPNLKLGFYIYSIHADYPMRYTPHPDFVGHFADITYSRYHSIEDEQSRTRSYYRNILEQWKNLHEQQGNPLWFYGYNWNLAENLFPYTKARIWGEDLPYYHDMGVIGHNNEQDKAWAILGPHNYIMARMGWDADADWRQLLREYCEAAFGKAAEPMMDYYLLLDETQSHAGIESGAYPTVPLVLDETFISQARPLLQRAAQLADTPEHQQHVAWFSHPLAMLEHLHQMRDAFAEGDFVEAKNQYDQMMSIWQRHLDADPNLVSRYGHLYVDRWCMKPFLDKAVEYSTGDYALVHELPEQLPTRFDGSNQGHMMNYQHPGKDIASLPTTHTWASTWDAQGMGGYRDGGVWYYDTFDFDRSLADGQGVGLLVGAVEDTVQVYLNGQYVGKGRGYFSPFVFDLTDHLNPQGHNVLALHVYRTNPINEALLGGMLYPSFVFVGPRLEQKAPAQEPMRRVLPGGARGEVE